MHHAMHTPDAPMPETRGLHLSEAEARDYFRDLCWDEEPFCPKCGTRKLYQLREGRRRCSACGYTFHDFCRRWISRCAIPLRDWAGLLRLFTLGEPVQQAAKTLGLSYNTAYKAFCTMRMALLAGSDRRAAAELAAHGQVDCGGDEGPEERLEDTDMHAAPVFAVHLEGECVRLEHMRGLSALEVLSYPVPKRTWRTFLYTEKFNAFDALLFCCSKAVAMNYDTGLSTEPLRLDREGRFWPYARSWLAKYRCNAPETSFLYLKEIEYRYNHRGRNIFPLLAAALCGLVPELEDSEL
jgi:transposase